MRKYLALNKKSIFREIKKSKPFFTQFFTVRHMDNESQLCIGIITSKKLGNAVFRNKCRRRMRSAIDLSLSTFQTEIKKNIVIVLKKESFNVKFSELFECVLSVFTKKFC
ncbi:ribonuclease P protein component [Candidatus Cytomitobacter indipagum]|uniref:Ribonuclease P protein component n=1 Tax=Candidatus Cytomitobacter indipagum TaxID=2601575 RepID=A0A5C0UEU0_9PROT|nr:ribonuclease P protein component [Candidatus Cytomitobacter indipagum]QEK38220.1 ribonuclease P protein component [Candidatus Cytomitobacter indipagum]